MVASPGRRDNIQLHSITGEAGVLMSKTSLDKSKIKILLLEGIHPSAVESFQADGYTNIESHPKALSESKLLEAIADSYFVGIRSATQLTARIFEHAPRLIGVGCFCIGTNQVDLDAAQERGDRKSTRLNSSHEWISRMPSSA